MDGTMCVRCTALLAMERAIHPMMTACFPKSDPSPELLDALAELGSRAAVVMRSDVEIEWGPDAIRHASDRDCPGAPVGDCDVCLTVVDVVGVDGCAIGVNHRAMNVRRRDGRQLPH